MMECYVICILSSDGQDSFTTTWHRNGIDETYRLADRLAYHLFGDLPHFVNVYAQGR